MKRRPILIPVFLILLSVGIASAQQQQPSGGNAAQPQGQQAATEGTTQGSDASSQAQQLATQLANPVANLISLPIEIDYDSGLGPEDGSRLLANIQPVIPFGISKHWNLISRTILPIVSQTNILADSGSQFGIGDILQSLFFSPATPSKRGWIWGAGPVLLLPTATDDLLGEDKWGAGPTLVALKQTLQRDVNVKTVGFLVNHVWDFAGNEDRPDINATFIQPFYAITTPKAATYLIMSESTYDWESNKWLAPIIVSVDQLTTLAGQPVSLEAGLRYWISSPPGGPEGFGVRFAITYLFPTK